MFGQGQAGWDFQRRKRRRRRGGDSGGGGSQIITSPGSLVALTTASIGDTVGTIAVLGGSGSYTFSLTSNPGTLFSVSGNLLKVAASLSVANDPITLKGDNGAGDTPTLATVVVVSNPTTLNIVGGGFSDPDNFLVSSWSALFPATGDSFSDTDVFFTAVVAGGSGQGISGGLFTDSEVFLGATLLSTAAITGSLFTDSETFYSSVVGAAGSIGGTLFADSETFFTAVVSMNVVGVLFADSDTFFGATFAQPGAAVTMDPANNASTITLSNGNLTVTAASTNGNGANVVSTTSHTTGKYYLEFTAVSGMDNFDAVGLCDSSAARNNAFLGGDTHSYARYSHLWTNGASVGFPSTPWGVPSNGDIMGLAIDLTNKLFWLRETPASNWNNDASADPATGTNGISISGISGAIFFAVEMETAGHSGTVNFGATSYSGTPPSGFGNW